MNKVTSVEDYKIVSNFQALRKQLLEDKYSDRLEKPLAYWALPNDRRLPMAFLGRTIKDLLATPFEELSATPGIGQKKISSLVKLLSRATKDSPPEVPIGDEATEAERVVEKKKTQLTGPFDPSIVSEALWSQWIETVHKHDVGHEKLGRLAPTLQALPTVIWHTPLSHYMDYSVSEIRQLRTHGEKRVRVVLEVFSIVHQLLADAGTESHLSIRLVPKFTEPLERWVLQALEGSEVPSEEEVRDNLTIPLLNQTKIDAGDTIHELSEGRLGISGAPQSVRQQSKRMEVTRARVYQLLEECSKVMSVRWPEGQQLLASLVAKYQGEGVPKDKTRLLLATVELFFPGKRRLADEDTGA